MSMKRGPKPKPSAVKDLQGNPGKRPYDPEEEIQADAAPLEPPEWADLKGRSLEMWQRIAPILRVNRLLTRLDVMQVIRYCEMWAQWLTCKEKIESDGYGVQVYKVDKNGKPTSEPSHYLWFPEVAMFKWLDIALARKEAEFGLTPSARTRIRLPKVREDAPGTSESSHDSIDDALGLPN